MRHLAALEAVAEEGSFNRAARRLGYTQSAISHQLAALEKIVGEQLVVRPDRSKPVAATPAGEIVLDEARAILARLRVAHAEVEALREGAADVARVGLFPGLGGVLASALVAHFSLDDPRIQLEHAAGDASLVAPLARGELDLAFVTLPLEPGPLVAEELFREELHVVTSDDELAAKPRLDGADLHGRPIVCLRSCRATASALARLDAHDVRADVAYRSDDAGTLLALAAAGAASALLPELALESVPRGLAVRSVDRPQLHRRIGIAWRREDTPSGTAAEVVGVVRAALAGTREIAAVS